MPLEQAKNEKSLESQGGAILWSADQTWFLMAIKVSWLFGLS